MGDSPMAAPLRANISQIDDPQGQGRVKVRCTALGEAWEAWAQVLRPDPANPPPAYAPGDVVIILLEEEDPGSPIVLGTLSSRGKPVGVDLASEVPRTDHGWSDLALSAKTRGLLDQVIAAFRRPPGRRVRERRTGSAVLISGTSGSDRIMAAQLVAKELGSMLLRVDLTRVVSKYIGETEKNLDAIFIRAEASGAVLFFDEADALFGKRPEVKDSHDRYANIEIRYLLQRLEEHAGLVILATNRKQAIDPAFLRRCSAIVSIPGPHS